MARLLPLRARLLWNGLQTRRRVPHFVDNAPGAPRRPSRLVNRVLSGLRFVGRMHRENLRLVRAAARILDGVAAEAASVIVLGHGDALEIVLAAAKRRLRIDDVLDWSAANMPERLGRTKTIVLAVLADHAAWVDRLTAAGIDERRIVIACPVRGEPTGVVPVGSRVAAASGEALRLR